MKLGTICKIGLIVMAVVAFRVHGGHASSAGCIVARDFMRDGMKTFAKDQLEGIRLLEGAAKKCPEDAYTHYNLGWAYFTYGNYDKAETALKQAVKRRPSDNTMLNLLAWVMLSNGSDAKEAYGYAKKAQSAESGNPAMADTLLWAAFESGRLSEAVDLAGKFQDRWKKDQKIQRRCSDTVDGYIKAQLALAKDGKYKEARQGLKKVLGHAGGARAHCWVLHLEGRTADALDAARDGEKRFGGGSVVAGTFDKIMDSFIQDAYRKFNKGTEAAFDEAYVMVDRMRDRFPANAAVKKAQQEMYAALRAGIAHINAPGRTRPDPGRGGGKQTGSEEALDELIAGRGESGETIQVKVDTEIPEGAERRPNSLALIIGNRNYQKVHVPAVEFAHRDAAVMKKYLIRTVGLDKKNIIEIYDATLADMRSTIGTPEIQGRLEKQIKYKNISEEIFVYYAGHGAPGPQNRKAYLMPVDASADAIEGGGYCLGTLTDVLGKLPVKKVTVVLDACFSGNSDAGSLYSDTSITTYIPANPEQRIKNGALFTSTSSQGQQLSHWFREKRHSLFTYFFFKGLQGYADRNKDRRITVGEMETYLKSEVPREASNQKAFDQVPAVVCDHPDWVMATLK